ncbi:MAG TPA: oxidoreductase [Janthinobacterium sp.]|nr:oxidoreductase [Janthinobacterium sp.]
MFDTRAEIIKNGAVVANDWGLLRLDEGDVADSVVVPAGKVIVPHVVWLAQRDTLAARLPEIGVWLASDARPEALGADVQLFAVIGIDFPKFTDGRGYSIAYNLRARLGYKGELRAIGDVLRDQLFSMHRVGFDAYATRPDRSIHDALKGLSVFSETYQASWDDKTPLFRRHHREVQKPDVDAGYGI